MIWRSPVPSTLTTYRWPTFAGPARFDENAMLRPSGDHAGQPSKAALFERFTSFDPSTFATKTSEFLDVLVRSHANAGVSRTFL